MYIQQGLIVGAQRKLNIHEWVFSRKNRFNVLQNAFPITDAVHWRGTIAKTCFCSVQLTCKDPFLTNLKRDEIACTSSDTKTQPVCISSVAFRGAQKFRSHILTSHDNTLPGVVRWMTRVPPPSASDTHGNTRGRPDWRGQPQVLRANTPISDPLMPARK